MLDRVLALVFANPTADLSQALRNGFRTNIALRRSEHFKTNHKLAYGRGTQERWIKVRVQVPFTMTPVFNRLLVKAH